MVKNIVRAQLSGRELATTTEGSTLMSTTRILWTLLVTGTLALAATGTQAQSIAQPGQSQERQDSTATNTAQTGGRRPSSAPGLAPPLPALRQLITFHADGPSSARCQAKSASTPRVRRTRRPMASGATLARGGSA